MKITLENFFIKIALAFRSKTAWTIATLLAAQLPAIKDQIPPAFQGIVDVVLGILAIYFRMNPSEPLNAAIRQVENHPNVG